MFENDMTKEANIQIVNLHLQRALYIYSTYTIWGKDGPLKGCASKTMCLYYMPLKEWASIRMGLYKDGPL